MLAYALLSRPEQFRNRRAIWFIDNIAALMALIPPRPPASTGPGVSGVSSCTLHLILLSLLSQSSVSRTSLGWVFAATLCTCRGRLAICR